VERSAETTRDDPDGEYLKRNRWFESGSLQQRVGNEISCIAAVPRADEFIRVSRSLTSAKYRDPLNLDQHFRACETSDGNQRPGQDYRHCPSSVAVTVFNRFASRPHCGRGRPRADGVGR
jgi:hypothetical protein